MIENFGGVQVLDWGIAKQLKRGSSAQGLTVDGKGMGSLAYMPPEQFLGEWDRVDERADVFALGAILCVILSNEAPHAWGPLREANLSKAIERLKASGHEPGLINIAVQCLSYDPADRPSDAGAVLKLLEIYRVEVVERLKTIEIDKAITAKAARLEQEQEIAALKARAKDSRRRRQKLLWLGIILFIGVGLLTTGTLVWSKLRDIATVQAFSQSSREASGVGDRRKAIDEYNKARDGYESLLSSSFLWNRHKYEFELAEVCTHLAELLEKDREGTAAEIALRQAQALLEKLRKDEAITRDQLDLALAEVHHHWGIHLAQRSDHSKAVEHYNTSVRLREGVVSTNRSSRDYRRNLALAYGYKGDSELEIEDFRQAKESYDAACRFRKLLAEEMPDDLEAHCLHARDFENFARLCDRQGKTEDALRMYRERNRHYGIRSELDRLPGAYWLERANTNLDIAEYRLLCASPTDDLTEIEMCLNAAGNEYNFLGEGGPQEDFPSDLQSALARLYVCQSRLEHLRGAAHLRNQAAENAIKLLNILDDSTKARPSDYYQLAVAHALLGAEDRNDSNRILARDRLLKAKRKGFNDTKRVKRDGILSQALAVDAQ